MMRIDLSVGIKETQWNESLAKRTMTAFGHLGTHIDVMNKEFPLENAIRGGKIVDVSFVRGRDIETSDADLSEVSESDFVMFHTGYLSETGYGSDEYSGTHPQLSRQLIDFLLDRKVCMIGIDAAGIRRAGEHKQTDQYCADRGVFVVENLANLDRLYSAAGGARFTVYTFPMNLHASTGLPCRVIAEVQP